MSKSGYLLTTSRRVSRILSLCCPEHRTQGFEALFIHVWHVGIWRAAAEVVGQPSLQPHVLEEASRKGSSEFPVSELVSVLSIALKAPCMLVYLSSACACPLFSSSPSLLWQRQAGRTVSQAGELEGDRLGWERVTTVHWCSRWGMAFSWAALCLHISAHIHSPPGSPEACTMIPKRGG